ncbi:MAG TPA: hypothetical protein VG939_00190, partial [Caulobacteraceae bacterium]|nr:hypothetical protein [Caulobacteraceae bacterium]
MRAIGRWTAVVCLVGLAACGGPGYSSREDGRVAMREIHSDLAAVATADIDHLPKIDPNSAAGGEAGDFSRTLKAYMIHIVDDRQAYHHDLEATGFEAAAQPAGLGRPGGVARARALLASARAVVVRYRSLQVSRMNELRTQVST